VTVGRLLRVVATAAIIALLVAVLQSGGNVVSVAVWVGVFSVVVLAVTTYDFVAKSRVEPARLLPAWARTTADPPDVGNRSLQQTRALVSSAQGHPLTFDKGLKPHLVALAGHFLPRRLGIDPDRDPDRVAGLLGEVGWLIEPAAAQRAPTTAELERFLEIVVGDPET
jgi:hypothetical protein